jgi:hypothetical protein
VDRSREHDDDWHKWLLAIGYGFISQTLVDSGLAHDKENRESLLNALK